MTQKKSHRIQPNYKNGPKRSKYKAVDNFNKNDAFLWSSDIKDWQTSRARQYFCEESPNLF